jgi:hypothetical protein
MSQYFFDTLNNIIKKHNTYSGRVVETQNHQILPSFNIDDEDVTPNDILIIAEGIKNADLEQINRIPIFKKYLERTDEYFENKHSNRRVIDSLVPKFVDQEVPLNEFQLFLLERDIQQDIGFLLGELNSEDISKLFDLVKPTEQMALKSLERQKKLPQDMIREIGSNLGKIPKGGRKKSNKSGMKAKTKRRKKTKKNKRKHR